MLFILVILLLLSVFTDYRDGKIPNLVILVGSITGIVLGQDLHDCLFQAVIVIFSFFPFYLLKALGAGDIKCMAMSALYLTAEQLLSAILYTFLIAAAISVLKMIFLWLKGNGTELLRSTTIHLAFPIFLGVLLSIGGNLSCIIF